MNILRDLAVNFDVFFIMKFKRDHCHEMNKRQASE